MKFRKITAIGLALCMSAAITACGSNNTHKETVNTESVATTATSRTETNETKKPSVSVKPTETTTPTPTKAPETKSEDTKTETAAPKKDKTADTEKETVETKGSEKTNASSTAKTNKSKSSNASSKASAKTETKPAPKPSSGSTSETTTSKPQTPAATPNPTPETKPEPTTPQHTHNYTASVTAQPTCSTAGTRTYSCACGDSYSESVPATGNHNWVHHDATGHYEEKIITPERTETIYEGHAICNGCGNDFGAGEAGLEAIGIHIATTDCWNPGSYHTESIAVGTETIPAVTESIWVEDSAAYDSCSVCGATK